MKVPISLIVDDPAPIISVYHEHCARGTTEDGRPLLPTFPNSFLNEFCDIVEHHGIRGKFSIVPMPGNKGDIVHGLEGVPRAELDEWLNTVKRRLLPAFTVCPEMLTHHKAVDLATGEPLPMNEEDWSNTQTRETLTPYIAKALTLLREAGFDPIGVTSPWRFGLNVEDDYQAAVSQAVFETSGCREAWLFLRGLRNCENAKPWIVMEEDDRTLVCIPPTTYDRMWGTIHTTRADDEYVTSLADLLITEDGKGGDIPKVLATGGYPILITHWQSLMSNGLRTGLRVLDEVGQRIHKHLSDRVEWMSFEEILRLVLSNKADYPKPVFPS